MSTPQLSSMSHSVLDTFSRPEQIRTLDESQLKQLAFDVRQDMIQSVSKTGGHLGAGLGVVELTIAIHYVFNTPVDKLIFDVGHQCYPHKILTGRRDRMHTLRQGEGLSGFTKRDESVYDPFGAAHSSTSISAGLGFAAARDLNAPAETGDVICVIGDGAMSAGMAYEAMNNAGALKKRLIVILNDNDMSIAPPVGAMSSYLARLWSGKAYKNFRDGTKSIVKHLPERLQQKAKQVEEYTKGMTIGGTLFEELGFTYIGPVDGHDFNHLLPVLKNVQSHADGPILVHCVTQKGKGYAPAEVAADKYHGVSKFNVTTGEMYKTSTKVPSYTGIFAKTLIQEAKNDPYIVAVTAAMPSGTGLDKFAATYPERFFDVGIAEQHAVTFCAALAASGMKPFATIYSTFLQRAYDQVVHDVAIQNLPVRFAIDRAGLVGADGPTHAGAFDLAYLCCLPNMVVMAPADEAELMHMIATQVAYDKGPSACRYPRGEGWGIDLPEKGKVLEIGKGRILKNGSDVAVVSLGSRLRDSLDAAKQLEQHGISTTVCDARFAKPLDEELLLKIAQTHTAVVTIEEGSKGGFGAQVLHLYAENGVFDTGLKMRTLTLPDIFQDQNTISKMITEANLDTNAIVKTVLNIYSK